MSDLPIRDPADGMLIIPHAYEPEDVSGRCARCHRGRPNPDSITCWTRCGLCGHLPSDHPDQIMGAVADIVPLCHTDDHSCYERWTVHRERPSGPRGVGYSTCPMCGLHWLVTPMHDVMLPVCGCFGDDVGPDNPNRPCFVCGLLHVSSCPKVSRSS